MDTENARLYPEHAKLDTLNGENERVGEFLEWLMGRYILSNYHQHNEQSCFEFEPSIVNPKRIVRVNACGYTDEQLEPARVTIEGLLAEYYGIDYKKLMDEKQAMLDRIRGSM